MRVLVVENFANTSLGLVGTALAEKNAELHWLRPLDSDPVPESHAGHDALIVLGGEQSAIDDDDHPYLPDLVRLMRDFGDASKAVLGICLGSQLLARAHGGENHLGIAPQFGWHPVELTEHGESDPMLSAAGGSFPIFEWHSDTFTLPQGAVRLARHKEVENQAFRIGRACYGTQFHFEADAGIVEGWTRNSAPAVSAMRPDWHGIYERERQAHAALSDAAGLAMARAWVSLIEVAA